MGRSSRGMEMSAGYRILSAIARLLLLLQVRLRVSHPERVPGEGAVLLVCNHLGVADPYVVAVRVPRQIRILAKAEIFEWPMLGGLARWGGAVPVRRGESDREALRILQGVLSSGQCALVFPEGGYSEPPEPGRMVPVKPGAALLALRSGAIVVPVGVWGSERVWRRSRGWRPWRRVEVFVRFGEPYRPTAPLGLSTKAAFRYISDDMARRVAALLPEHYRGYYAALPADIATR